MPAGESFRPVRIAGVQRHRDEPVRRVEGVVADVPGGYGLDRNAGPGGMRGEPGEIRVHLPRFPAGVGEDGDVERRYDAVTRQQQDGGRLNSGAERQQPQRWNRGFR